MIQKIATKTVFSLLIASLSLCGCDKEPASESGHVIRFSPSVGDLSISTRGVARIESESALINAGGTFQVSCWNGTETVIDDETVTYSNGVWTAAQVHIWPEGATLKFFAYANEGTGASDISMSSTGGVSMSYAVPDSEDNQTDLLVGTYTGTGDNGTATINFVHPMTNVVIKKGTLPDGYAISGLTLGGVKRTGNLSYNGTACTWSGLGTSGSFTKAWTPSFSGTEMAGYMFIPQDIAAMTISATIVGETVPFTATLENVSWSSGKCYTYTLNIASPDPGDHTLSLDVTVQDFVPETSQDLEVSPVSTL